jgi:signal transduction histidine kinase
MDQRGSGHMEWAFVGRVLATFQGLAYSGPANVGAMDLPSTAHGSVDDTWMEVSYASFPLVFDNLWNLAFIVGLIVYKITYKVRLILALLLSLTVMGTASSQSVPEKIDSAWLAQIPRDTSSYLPLLRTYYHFEFTDTRGSFLAAKKLLDISLEFNDLEWVVTAYEYLIHSSSLLGDHQESLNYALELFEIYKKGDDVKSLTNVLNTIGNAYFELDIYNRAYDYFLKSLKMAEEIEDKMTVAITTYNIARVYRVQENYEKAMEWIINARDLSRAIDDTIGEAYIANQLGKIYLSQKKYEQAREHFEEGIKMCRRYQVQDLLPFAINDLAGLLVELGELDTARELYAESNKIMEGMRNKIGMAESLLGQAKMEIAGEFYESALTYLSQSLELSREIYDLELQSRIKATYSELYEKMGDYKNALRTYKNFKSLEDSIFNSRKMVELSKLQQEYENETKDKEIALQKKNLERVEMIQNILVVILALIIILMINLYRSGQRRRKINQLLVKHQNEMEIRGKELMELNHLKDKFFSIISHDLRSPVNALSGVLDLMEQGAITPEEQRSLIKSLQGQFEQTRNLLDNLLDWALVQMDKIVVKLESLELHKVVAGNIKLLRVAQEKRIDLKNNVNENLKVLSDPNMVNLVLRNLMLNAIKFTNNGGEVVVSAEQEGEWVVVSVKDNGVGISPENLDQIFDKSTHYSTRGTANEKGTGLGLKLCKEFVEKNGGKIWVESEVGKGSTFKFTLKKAD